MPTAQQHKYTVTTPHGDVNLSTPNHHSGYDSVEAFLKAHKATVETTVGVSGLAIHGLGLYLSHGRGGAKLK